MSSGLSASAPKRPAIGSAVSSLTICGPGTVFTGGSFTGLTVIATVSVSVNCAVGGRDRQRVGAVEIEVAAIAQARERRC